MVRSWKCLLKFHKVQASLSKFMRLCFSFVMKNLGSAGYGLFWWICGTFCGLSTSWNESSLKTGSADAANNSGKIPKQLTELLLAREYEVYKYVWTHSVNGNFLPSRHKADWLLEAIRWQNPQLFYLAQLYILLRHKLPLWF